MVSHVHIFEQALAEASQVAQAPVPQPEVRQGEKRKSVRHIQRATVPFIRGPIPLRWMTTASAKSRSAARLSVALWYRLGITGQHANLGSPQDSQLVVRIDRQLRNECSLQRWHVSEGIQDLADAGLIRPLKAGRGRCPVVEIIA
jgi:hypothetical protein